MGIGYQGEEIDRIVVSRVSDLAVPSPGSIRGEACSQCGHEVWIAPGTAVVRHEVPKAPLWCYRCLVRVHGFGGRRVRRRL